MCRKCGKPIYVHTEPECTKRSSISKLMQTVYTLKITENETIKQEVKWALIDAGVEEKEDKNDKDQKFPLWQEGWTWEQYKREIGYYKEASTRKPINQIMDMIRALKESKQVEIADTLITEMEEVKHDDDIID